MSNLKTAHRNEGETMSSPRWQDLYTHLQAAKRPIFQEIRTYPPQVAGCDLHFKTLTEKRDAICRELDRLEALQGARDDELDAFVASRPFWPRVPKPIISWRTAGATTGEQPCHPLCHRPIAEVPPPSLP